MQLRLSEQVTDNDDWPIGRYRLLEIRCKIPSCESKWIVNVLGICNFVVTWYVHAATTD